MKAAKTEEKPLIVWVEDNRDYQTVVKEWLLPRYDVVTYDNGEDFLEDLQDMQPDMIMLDVRLPGPDGFKLCRKVRAESRLKSVPILFLTSNEEDEAYIEHLDVGGTGFINKPVDKKKLLSVIGELVDGERLGA